MAAGNVHTDDHVVEVRRHLSPTLDLAAGFVQYPDGHRLDQARLFSYGHELAWRYQPAFTVVPSQQSFEPDEPPVGKIHDGLVIERKLVPVDGMTQIHLETDAF